MLIGPYCNEVGGLAGVWFRPIVYAPSDLRRVLTINPMTTLVRRLQIALLFDKTPELTCPAWLTLATPVLVGAALALRRARGVVVESL